MSVSCEKPRHRPNASGPPGSSDLLMKALLPVVLCWLGYSYADTCDPRQRLLTCGSTQTDTWQPAISSPEELCDQACLSGIQACGFEFSEESDFGLFESALNAGCPDLMGRALQEACRLTFQQACTAGNGTNCSKVSAALQAGLVSPADLVKPAWPGTFPPFSPSHVPLFPDTPPRGSQECLFALHSQCTEIVPIADLLTEQGGSLCRIDAASDCISTLSSHCSALEESAGGDVVIGALEAVSLGLSAAGQTFNAWEQAWACEPTCHRHLESIVCKDSLPQELDLDGLSALCNRQRDARYCKMVIARVCDARVGWAEGAGPSAWYRVVNQQPLSNDMEVLQEFLVHIMWGICSPACVRSVSSGRCAVALPDIYPDLPGERAPFLANQYCDVANSTVASCAAAFGRECVGSAPGDLPGLLAGPGELCSQGCMDAVVSGTCGAELMAAMRPAAKAEDLPDLAMALAEFCTFQACRAAYSRECGSEGLCSEGCTALLESEGKLLAVLDAIRLDSFAMLSPFLPSSCFTSLLSFAVSPLFPLPLTLTITLQLDCH